MIYWVFLEEIELVISKIQCKDQNLEIVFMSQEEVTLNGEIIITPELNYQEARSENITSKIKELTKLRFNQTPSIKSSGSILDLLEKFIMCGRFATKKSASSKKLLAMIEPRFNIAPNQKINLIADSLLQAKWGFTPYWAKEPHLINARSETIFGRRSL